MRTLYVDRHHMQHIKWAEAEIVAGVLAEYEPDAISYLADDRETLVCQALALGGVTDPGILLTTVRGREFWAMLPPVIKVEPWNGRMVNPLGLQEWALMQAPDGPHFVRTKAREVVKKGSWGKGKYHDQNQAALTWLSELEAAAPEYVRLREERGTDHYKLVEDLPAKFLSGLLESSTPLCAFDIETTGLDRRNDSILGISFCNGPEVYYLPTPGGVVPPVAAAVLAHPHIQLIAHNAGFDYQFLRSKGYTVSLPYHDTQVMAYLLQLPRNGLKDLAEDELKVRTVHFQELVGEDQTFADVPMERAYWYGCQDADLTFQLCQLLEPRLRAEGNLHSVYRDIEIPLIPIIAHMEMAGAPVDQDAARELARSTERDIAILEPVMWDCAGQEFDPNSAQDLSYILYQKLGLHPLRENKTGYSTDKFVLEALKDEHQLVNLILQWRSRTKLLNTYLHPILERGGDRVYGRFNQTVTVTGRLSSSGPNLQQQDPVSRTVYRVPEGRLLVAADYAQQELRLLAHMSQDPNMLAAFRNGVDIHEQTAQLLRIPRRLAKNVNFGIPYGAGPGAIARQGKCTTQEAAQMLEEHKNRYPVLWDYIQHLKDLAKQRGYAESIWGRRRYLPKIYSRVPEDVAAAERESVNMPIQGSAADVTKLAMIEISRDLEDWAGTIRMILQVHDELVFELDEEGALEAVIPVIEAAMQRADGGRLSVPLKVEAKWGRKWSDLK